MPTTQELRDLFRAIAAHDLDQAANLAERICAAEEKKGHRSAARTLRSVLHRNGNANRSVTGLLPQPDLVGSQFLTSALVQLPTSVGLDAVVLESMVRRQLESVISEWRKKDVLSLRDLAPRCKLLFHGPPGCGKSLTARAIANELGLPAYLVRFDSIIGAYLGQTAIHLRQLFHFAESQPCVLLLDELDALGKQRGNPLDVGELDRIVIALMQELEHSRPSGVIIATSNLAKNLDRALWRRFDLAINFRPPTRPTLRRYARQLAAKYEISLPKSIADQAESVKSFADSEAIVLSEARRQALQGK